MEDFKLHNLWEITSNISSYSNNTSSNTLLPICIGNVLKVMWQVKEEEEKKRELQHNAS